MGIRQTLGRSLFGINLILIWIFGVSALAWTLFYTDWFPEVGGVLALGGVFSWLAFVGRILSDDRIKAMQAWIDRYFLSRLAATLALMALIVAEVVWTGHRSTIRIESLQETAERVVRVYTPAGALTAGPLQLPTHGQLHILLASGGDPLRIFLKVSGYPNQEVALQPREIAERFVPDSFLRPVILLRPTVDLIESVANHPAKLQVLTGGHTAVIAGFTGQAVWIGCDDDVDIPPALQDAWRAELGARQKPELVQKWLNPEAAVFAGEPNLALRPRQSIQVKEEGWRTPLKVITVRPVVTRASFPQVEDLDVPKTAP